jgi:hypothetical protein
MVTIKYDKDDEIAHSGNGVNTSQTHDIQANLVIRHGQLGDSRHKEGRKERSGGTADIGL